MAKSLKIFYTTNLQLSELHFMFYMNELDPTKKKRKTTDNQKTKLKIKIFFKFFKTISNTYLLYNLISTKEYLNVNWNTWLYLKKSTRVENFKIQTLLLENSFNKTGIVSMTNKGLFYVVCWTSFCLTIFVVIWITTYVCRFFR